MDDNAVGDVMSDIDGPTWIKKDLTMHELLKILRLS